jgi:hypothetical protein
MPLLMRSFFQLMLIGLAACAGAASGAQRDHRPEPQRDVLTRDEILASTSNTGDLLRAIQSLRPNFLVTHNSAHSQRSAAALPLAVYVGQMRQTGLDALKSISAANVAEVKYLDPTAAQNQFGFGATGGALVVKLYEKPKDPDGA